MSFRQIKFLVFVPAYNKIICAFWRDGRMNKLVNLYFELHNIKTRIIRWPLFKIKNKSQVCLLKNNRVFEKQFEGKRCFILGNGPSLKSVDLSLLSDEYTFTVNQASRNPQFHLLKTNFHFWVDPVFFDIDLARPADVELLDYMKHVKDNNNSPKVFYPVEREAFVKKFDLDKSLDVFYFKSGLHFMDSTKKIDYTKIVPGFGTVVQWCITMAIFMGFKEIYLLGCDNTGLINNIKASMNTPVTEYNYEITANEQERLEKQSKQKPLYDYVLSYADVLKDYDLLCKYCSNNGILLINCTQQSAIDCIPQCKLEDVLRDKQDSIK